MNFVKVKIMNAKVSQTTVDELREVFGAVVEEKLQASLAEENDLELTDELKARLFRQTKEIENGKRGEALEDIAARFGLNQIHRVGFVKDAVRDLEKLDKEAARRIIKK